MRNPTARRQRLLALLLFSFLLFEFNAHWVSAASQQLANEPRFPHTLTGDIRFIKNFHSRFLTPDRDIAIYLPPDYDKKPLLRYPVLYMQDGQNLFDAATSFFPRMERHFDERAQALIATRTICPLIIVGVYSTGLTRINEYTPTKAPGTNRGGEADLYGQMLVEEIKPLIDSQYRTLPARASLGGSSLGGLLTVYLGLKYRRTFVGLAVTSPASQWDNQMLVRYVGSLPRRTNQRIWLSVGTAEPDGFLRSARGLREALIAKGWKEGSDLRYSEVLGAQHNPGAWTPGVDRLLEFLFPPEASTGIIRQIR